MMAMGTFPTRLAGVLFVSLLTISCRGGAGRDLVAAPDPVSLRIGTYNIRAGLDSAGVAQLDRIAADIRAANLDIVALQEVDNGTRRSGAVDQAAYLARQLHMNHIFGPTMFRVEGGRFGNAVLTRLDVLRSRNIRLPGSIFRVRRKVLETTLRDPVTGLELIFVAAHFSLDAGDRMRSAEWLNKAYSRIDVPVVLAGDLNEAPSGPAAGLLLDRWAGATTGARLPTYPAADPRIQIDFLLAQPNNRVYLENPARSDPSSSDHLLLSARLTVFPPR
jgi:endonuclease/exonuclease/phosphatase family metal-dependent hydrolase